MMRIYLCQHGSAMTEAVDPNRPLTEEGRQDIRRLGAFLQGAGIRVDQILHSGKARAKQTATLLASAILAGGQPKTRTGLGPDDPLEPMLTEIQYATKNILIVGHQPFLGRLGSLLLGAGTDRPTLGFKPGTLACLERDAEGRWLLVFMIRPDLLVQATAASVTSPRDEAS